MLFYRKLLFYEIFPIAVLNRGLKDEIILRGSIPAFKSYASLFEV